MKTEAARQCGRVVAESIEEMIFRGIPELGIEGIYTNAGKTYTPEKPWNGKEANPYDDILNMVSMLGETSKYKPKFMVLDPDAYYSLARTNSLGVSYLKMIEDAGIFPNGRKDIYMAPGTANPEHPPIIPKGGGLIGDYGPGIAERYVQQIQAERLSGDEAHYSDIYMTDFPMTPNNMWLFNVQSYQGIGIKFKEAFLKLETLTTKKSI